MKLRAFLILVCTLLTNGGCEKKSNPPKGLSREEKALFLTTDPKIAIANLNAEIQSLEFKLKNDPKLINVKEKLISLLLMQTTYFGQYENFERILKVSEMALSENKNDPKAYLLRAKSLIALHRFKDAEKALQTALERGANPSTVEKTKKLIEHATGKNLKDVYRYRLQEYEKHKTFDNAILLAGIESDIGDFEASDSHFTEALELYNDVSPFTVAYVYFQQGLMWSEKAGNPMRGAYYYQLALDRLPQFAGAAIHLSEIDLENNHIEKALARMNYLIQKSDPEIYSMRADIYEQMGDPDAATKNKKLSAQNYKKLLAKHEAAFLDHASEFFRSNKKTARYALHLALKNLSGRPTERAYLVAIKAANSAEKREIKCELIVRAKQLQPVQVPVIDLIKNYYSESCR